MNRLFAGVVCLVIMIGCALPDRKDKMIANTLAWEKNLSAFSLGVNYQQITNKPVADRIRQLKWSSRDSIKNVLRILSRPSYSELRVKFSPLDYMELDGAIESQALDVQSKLRQEWINRISSIFKTSTFEVDETALSNALSGDGIVIHYFLVGRYNSAEMGHEDVIQFVVLDIGGRVVAKTKNKYSLNYPLGFCEEKQWGYNFLL